jgi:hypothetical protein
MFVRPLALLISNIFTCFYCFAIYRSLHQILTKGAKWTWSQVKKWIPAKCVRPHFVRSNALTVARRPNQPASHANVLAGPGGYLQSTVWCTFDYKITACLSINRSLSSFGRGLFFFWRFLESILPLLAMLCPSFL